MIQKVLVYHSVDQSTATAASPVPFHRSERAAYRGRFRPAGACAYAPLPALHRRRERCCAHPHGEDRMNEEVRLSRLRVSRRRALAIGGAVGLSGVLAACATAGEAPSDDPVTTTAVVTDPAALLDVANTCILAEEKGQGPYWFDVDSIRSDIREGRPGLTLALALRVHDLSSCSVGGPVKPVPNAVVEIWHCDAGGVYSGYATIAAGRRGGPSTAPSSSAAPASDSPRRPQPARWRGARRRPRLVGRELGRLLQQRRPRGDPHRRRHLPARRPGDRRERGRPVHDDLPGVVRRPHDAHPLQGAHRPPDPS